MTLPANRYRPNARQRGEDTWRRILETALALFAAEGFEGASTREIAERAGVNLPAIQYYFGSKEGLYRETITHISDQVVQTIAANAANNARFWLAACSCSVCEANAAVCCSRPQASSCGVGRATMPPGPLKAVCTLFTTTVRL